MVNAVQKGKTGEKEFCEFLKVHFDVDLEREYNQASGNSTDIVFDPYFMFEIKRREKLDFDPWWTQVRHASEVHKRKSGKYLMPVVAFRQNRKQWEFLIPATLIGVDSRYLHVDKWVFLQFAKSYVEHFSEDE
jgi:hypothetical protein